MVAQSDPERGRLRLSFEMENVLVGTTDEHSARPSFPRLMTLPMPEDLREIERRGPSCAL